MCGSAGDAGAQWATFRARHGDRLLTPAMIPPAEVDLDRLPGNTVKAATGAIDVPGYRVEAVQATPTNPGGH
jgi:hypothetical protein